MSAQRKRKYGSYDGPSEDQLNESIKLLNDSIERSTSTHDDGYDDTFEKETVVFYDIVHGHIELPDILLRIIDTPQFQRLRGITQMGGVSYVYPGACHTRFQHCLGVAYLAGKLCKVLRRRQPELDISTVDILCVQIAGLCHDIGHGPFSKLFDKSFLPAVKPGVSWSHEDGSIDLFNYMWEENNLDSIFCDSLLEEVDLIFIKELITGSPLHSNSSSSSSGWDYKGRAAKKGFLYQVVSNKTSGVDVDKWDYLARDCFHLGIPNRFDYKRFLKFARVVSCGGKFHICTRDKDAHTMYELFHTRDLLQRRAVFHKTSRIAKLMLTEVLSKANDHVTIPGSDGQSFRISECINDMEAYTKLTDSIISVIETSSNEHLRESQAILRRLHNRDLYKFVNSALSSTRIDKSETELRDEIFSLMEEGVDVDGKENFIVVIEKYDYGMKDQNPIEKLFFYSKNEANIGIQLKQEDVSTMLPQSFSEQEIRLYSKKNDHFLLRNASEAFDLWHRNVFLNSGENVVSGRTGN